MVNQQLKLNHRLQKLLLCYGISLGEKSLAPNGKTGGSPLSSSACSGVSKTER